MAFGPNDVEMTLKRKAMKIWKSILSEQAASTMQTFNPIEYSNLFLSEDGYIYATAAGYADAKTESNAITKLNPLGINMLHIKFGKETLFSDVAVDESGVTTLLEVKTGVIYQLDKDGMLMFTMGGKGEQVGLFRNPVSLVQVKDKIYVLDAEKNTITEFERTEFGELVWTAVNLFNEGFYEESIGPWQEVVRRNSNYLVAYACMGKVYYQLGEYDKAMYYDRLANTKDSYSDAYKAASLQKMRESFGTIVLGIVLIAAAVMFVKYRKKRKGASV